MLKFLLAAIVGIAISAGARAATGPTVVELFTAQGCSSCPPADQLLAELAQTEGVLALAFHVNYWDRLGWKDPFGSEWATKRQSDYNAALGKSGVYTPQIIIDGTIEVPGSRQAAVADAIKQRHKAGHRVLVTAALVDDKLQVDVDGDQRATRPGTLWLVRYDGAYRTDIDRGENIGRRLTNTNIVRTLQPIGDWKGQPLSITVPVQRPPRGGIAVILQENNGGRILGAAKIAARTS
jgi:hypothetical protein